MYLWRQHHVCRRSGAVRHQNIRRQDADEHKPMRTMISGNAYDFEQEYPDKEYDHNATYIVNIMAADINQYS